MSRDHSDADDTDRAGSEFDERAVDILSWLLDTETRARIYVHLHEEPWSTSEEVATGTGLYPSTVREALASMAEDGVLSRRKRESEGAGNNPYEYRAIPPSDLVRDTVGDVQAQLNTLCNLDSLSGEERESESEPVHIEVESGDDDANPN
ncbi:MAG: helix-turn-helix domain-containing protein [Halobacteriaceae archaeon]